MYPIEWQKYAKINVSSTDLLSFYRSLVTRLRLNRGRMNNPAVLKDDREIGIMDSLDAVSNRNDGAVA